MSSRPVELQNKTLLQTTFHTKLQPRDEIKTLKHLTSVKDTGLPSAEAQNLQQHKPKEKEHIDTQSSSL